MIFCRYCGASIADDSLFCAKCGKKLGRSANPKLENIIKKLYLRTPYPYFGVLAFFVGIWMFMAREHVPPVDYSDLKWSLQSERKLDLPEDKLYEEALSLVLENGKSSAIRDIPVDFSAKIEPTQPAEIEARFEGQHLVIVQNGKPAQHLTVLLGDEVAPGKKRNFSVEGRIHAEKPFKVTYEIRERDSQNLLASYVVER
jgi:hypothetical protein